jgi:tRNA-Thr(GGU) m(6)t(6)A37 methyltransferase TsaA
MKYEFKAIGTVRNAESSVPRHWSLSEVEGDLVIQDGFKQGLADILPGEKIVVLFVFHLSPAFTPDKIRQTPPHRGEARGVFSTCSPKRPNPIGWSVLDVLEVRGNIVRVRGLDMLDGTPILDIKPFISGTSDGSGEKPSG